jgi:hypothetical protein
MGLLGRVPHQPGTTLTFTPKLLMESAKFKVNTHL